MSEASAAAPSPPGRRARGDGPAPLFLIFGAVVGLVALLVFLGRGDRLDESAIGLDGLGIWLRRNGVETVPLVGRAKEGAPQATLRILPLYDHDVADDEPDEVPASEKPLGTRTQRPLGLTVFEAKVAEAPTLAVLPKWRSGFPAGGKAHPDLLVPEDTIWFYGEAVARTPNLGLGDYRLTNTADGAAVGAATVYALQVLGQSLDDDCDPLVSIAGVGTIMAECVDLSSNGASFLVLSDPDLVDNHGLALGDNAAVALKLVAMAGTGPVFIDTSAGLAGEGSGTTDEAGRRDTDPHERSLADLSRFFAYPFSYVWAGVVLLTGLAVWRGSRRFGTAIPDDGEGDRSKRRTIEASGRILRLAGTERDLVDAHVRARMEALATALLRPRKTAATDEAEAARIETVLARRSPDLAGRFSSARRALADAGASERTRFDALELFERILQEIWHEFGRAAGPSRQDRR